MITIQGLVDRFPRPAARWSRLLGLGTLVGVSGGLAAAGLEWGLEHGAHLLVGRFTHLGGARVLEFHWGVLLLPALGGLASGLAVWIWCPTAVGHGTDVLTHAFHRRLGALPLRAPMVKGVASIGVISCGGSAGPEGPIAALGAALGSTIGRLFRLTPRERRVLLVAGCGAGIGAIFQCPLGGALFAASVLYREPEFESDAIVPAFVASVIGYSTFMLFPGFGGRMLDGADTLAFRHPLELTAYAVLGPLCGGLSIFFSACMRGVERRAEAWSRVPRWLWPAVGGLATGALALVLPQVMDGRYRFIQNTMDAARDATLAPDGGWLWWAGLFGAVALFKCVATALTVGTGASGGVLGPSVFIGGAAGAFLGAMCEAIHPGVLTPELRCALIPVGMAGVLSASMRTPLAAIVMVTEMTGSYGLIVPLMVVCVGAYLTGRRWGLNHEQVRTTAESPAHAADALVHMLESWRVSELMERNWPESVAPDATLSELVTRIRPGTRPVFAVVERAERDRVLLGVISVPDIRRIMDEPGLADALIASDIMTQRVATIHPDDDVYRVLDVFRREHHDVLPVVSRDHHRRWLGMLTRTRVFEAVQRRIADMHQSALREHTGLAAIEQEAHMQQLMLGVSAERSDKIQRLLVPLQAVGQSLRDADFRRQFGVQVIAIEQPDGTMQCPPDIDAPLRTEQRLVAIVGDEPGGRNADAPADTSRPKRDT